MSDFDFVALLDSFVHRTWLQALYAAYFGQLGAAQ